MAKRGRKPTLANYKKLAVQCSAELADKKKDLARAEKQLAKATKTHQELLQEVARLDMLDRSLRAVNEGLEPPQNVKYVYNYPQWVWNPGWWTYNTPWNTGTITLGSYQGGQTLANINSAGSNSQFNLTTSNNVPLSTTYTCNSGGLVGSSSAVPTSGSVLSSSSPDGVAWTNATPTYDAAAYQAKQQFQLNALQDAPGTITVDLSTHATEGECDGFCEPACATCAVEPTAVGIGG